MKLIRTAIATLVSTLFFAFGASARTCFNALTNFTPIGDLEYMLGSDKLMSVTADSEKYTCTSMKDMEDAGQSAPWQGVEEVLKTAMGNVYFPMVEKEDPNNEPYPGAYVCPEGVRRVEIADMKVCDLNYGESIKAGPFKIKASATTTGTAKGYQKAAFVVQYVCNQQARIRTASLRFNGKTSYKCKYY